MFEKTVLAHLNSAYNLARWLLGSEDEAEDAVQDACLRAFQGFERFQGGDSGAWLLKIVRNTCYTALARRGRTVRLSVEDELGLPSSGPSPEDVALSAASAETLKGALSRLPTEFMEVIVLREIEGMSYREIAEIADVPLGTVMSRLARGRDRLRALLTEALREGTDVR